MKATRGGSKLAPVPRAAALAAALSISEMKLLMNRLTSRRFPLQASRITPHQRSGSPKTEATWLCRRHFSTYPSKLRSVTTGRGKGIWMIFWMYLHPHSAL